MFIRLVEIYPCLELIQTAIKKSQNNIDYFRNQIILYTGGVICGLKQS